MRWVWLARSVVRSASVTQRQSETSSGSGVGIAIVPSDEDMVDLVLHQSAGDILGSVAEGTGRPHIRLDSHLLSEPPPRRIGRRLAWHGMSAAGVRPEPTEVVLARRPSLEQHPRHIVEQEDRDGEVEHPGRPVHFELVGGAGRAPVHVDEDDLIHEKSLPFVTEAHGRRQSTRILVSVLRSLGLSGDEHHNGQAGHCLQSRGGVGAERLSRFRSDDRGRRWRLHGAGRRVTRRRGQG